MSSTLNPGSDAAIEQGCRCPVLDNSHGRGYMGQPAVFVMVGDCPVHAAEIERILSQGPIAGPPEEEE